MGKQSHTPGPWKAELPFDGADNDPNWEYGTGLWIVAVDMDLEFSIASVRYGCTEAKAAGGIYANARLIAESPNMLEALKSLLSAIDANGQVKEGFLVDQARMTVARATS